MNFQTSFILILVKKVLAGNIGFSAKGGPVSGWEPVYLVVILALNSKTLDTYFVYDIIKKEYTPSIKLATAHR